MALNARVNVLTDELITFITGYDSRKQAQAFNACKEATSRNLRQHRFVRTNQFEVQRSLQGLLERLYVVNNEPLAEALHSRLGELDSREAKERHVDVFSNRRAEPSREIRWKTEILSLLLNLADQPAEKATLEKLEKIRPRSLSPERLTWKDIVGEAGLLEDKEWGEVEQDDSDDPDDDIYPVQSDASVNDETDRTSLDESVGTIDTESLIIETDPGSLTALKNGQKWRKNGDPRFAVSISELQAVREVLHMLLGLPTVLFEFGSRNQALLPSLKYYLETISTIGLEEILSTFASIGNKLNKLREFSRARKALPLLQTFSQNVEEHISAVDNLLLAVERSLAKPQGPVIASLLHLQDKIESASENVFKLLEIVNVMRDEDDSHAYRLLQCLYEKACTARLIGDEGAFVFLGHVLHNCLATYLKPITTWLENGITSSDKSFFILQCQSETDLPSFWQHAFELKMDNELPMAPSFLHPFVSKVFSTGKQVALMRKLGLSQNKPSISPPVVSIPSFETTLAQDNADLLPYADLLFHSLHDWTESRQRQTLTDLRDHLLQNAGLFQAIDALSQIYLSSNGSAFQSYAEAIFFRLESGEASWNNPHAIEDLARTAFAGIACIDTDSLTATTVYYDHTKTTRPLNTISLSYSLPGLLLNIIPTSSLKVYQSAATLLLNLRRTTTALSRLPLKSLPSSALSFRHKVLHAISTIHSHILHAGIATASVKLRREMRDADTVDDMISAHSDFMGQISRATLATDKVKGVGNAVSSLAELGIVFARKCMPKTNVMFGREHGRHDSDSDTNSEDELGEDANGRREEHHHAPIDPSRLRQMHEQFAMLISLVVAGLRSASRVGEADDERDSGRLGEADTEMWGVLADELEAGMQERRRPRRVGVEIAIMK